MLAPVWDDVIHTWPDTCALARVSHSINPIATMLCWLALQLALSHVLATALQAPPGCSRYTIELKKPLGLALEEDGRGGIKVAEVFDKGNAAIDGTVSPGDALISTTAIVYTREAEYQGNMVRSGEQTVTMNIQGEVRPRSPSHFCAKQSVSSVPIQTHHVAWSDHDLRQLCCTEIQDRDGRHCFFQSWEEDQLDVPAMLTRAILMHLEAAHQPDGCGGGRLAPD